MIDKAIHFLSGLPRTGSTLLGSILGQNPRVHVTPTSPMFPLLVETNECFNRLSVQYTYDHVAKSSRVYHSLIAAFYQDVREPVVFDKHRGWPAKVPAIKEFLSPAPKIIATVRPVAEVITSYLKLADRDPANFIDAHLRRMQAPLTNESRATLLWTVYLKAAYDSMTTGLRNHPECVLLVEYRDIVSHPSETLARIYDFCGLASFRHSFRNIENRCAEAKDEAWGLKNLHTIRPTLGYESDDPLTYLPREAVDYFAKFDLAPLAAGRAA